MRTAHSAKNVARIQRRGRKVCAGSARLDFNRIGLKSTASAAKNARQGKPVPTVTASIVSTGASQIPSAPHAKTALLVGSAQMGRRASLAGQGFDPRKLHHTRACLAISK